MTSRPSDALLVTRRAPRRLDQFWMLAVGAALVAAYVAAARLGFTLAFEAEQVTTVWAPTGIALASLLLWGTRLWPAVWAGAFLANAGTNAPLWTAGAIATGNTLEAVTAVWLLRRSGGFDLTLCRVGDVLRFLLVAVLLCTGISATVGVSTLAAAGVQPWSRFGALWLQWWFGDVLGAALVGPAMLLLAREEWTRPRAMRAAMFACAALLVTHLVFGQVFGLRAHPLEYGIFPLVIAAATIGGPPATALVALCASVVAIWHTVHGVGPFAGEALHESLIRLQAFMGVLAATALLLSAAVAERGASERREREGATMLRLAQRAGGIATFEWDLDNQRARCSSEFFQIVGLAPRDGTITSEEWIRLVHPDDRAAMAAHLARHVADREPASVDCRIVRADGTTRWLTYAGQLQPTLSGRRMLGTVVDITDRKRLEDDLRHHATEVERILESIGEGFVALDRQFRYVYVNRVAEDMLGRSRHELRGRCPWDVFTPETARMSRDQLAAVMESGVVSHFEVHAPDRGKWFENRIYPSPTGLSIFFSDVTDRVAAEAALRESRDVLSLAMKGGAMGAWSREIATNDVWWSQELEELFGLQPGAFDRTEAGFIEFVHPDDRSAVRSAVGDAISQGTDYIVEFRFRHSSGQWRWMEGRGRAVYAEGQPRMLYGLGIDITNRKQGEMALRQAKAAAEEGQQRLEAANRELARRVREQETLLDVLPIGIGIALDRECRHIDTNRAFADTLGLSAADNASKTAPAGERPTNFRVLTPEGTDVADDQLPMQIAAREGRDVRDVELDVVHDDGRVVRLLEYAAPVFDEHGVPRGAVGAFVDVTAAHHARVTLARSEERYRRIFETAGVSLWEQDFTRVRTALDELWQKGVNDLDTYLKTRGDFVDRCVSLVRVVDVNQATVRLFGARDKAELLQSLDRIFRPDTREVFAGELLALAQGHRQYQTEAAVQTLDGRPLHVVVSVAFPPPGEPLERVLVSVTDITARREAELALRQDVEVRTVLAQVGAALAGELRSDKVIEAVTDASTTLTGAEFGAFFYNVSGENGDSYSLYSLSGAPREAFERFPHPRATAIFGPTFRGEAPIRLHDVTRDERYGKSPPFHGMPAGHLPVRSYLAVPVIGRGSEVLGGLFFGHSQAGMFSERHELLATGIAGWAAIALDNARLYQEASEANRLKDEFLATLSHELRTPLNAVLGWAHMLREGTMQPSMRQRALESLERNARAQAQLVEDLLDVSRIMAGKLQIKSDAVDVATVVANAVETVRAGVNAKRLHLRLDLPDERVLVTGDAHRLQQVVWNLVSNAVKFTPAGGSVEVRVERVDSMAQIVVRDTGQGFDPSFRPHLFQRFRQMDASKTRVHGGLGLGLSIVRHLVEAHGGSVTAESDGTNLGATFRVELPVRAADVSLPDPSAPHPAGVGRALAGVRALVADDEADARELSRFILESRGAIVLVAGSSGEALHLLSADEYDVLIADIGMPEQDGLALIRALRGLPANQRNRDIHAIALTAYAGVRERDEALAAGFDCHLGKPVDPEQLIAAVMVGQQDGRK